MKIDSIDILGGPSFSASPGSVWYAWANSVKEGNASGWIFTAPPVSNPAHNSLFFTSL